MSRRWLGPRLPKPFSMFCAVTLAGAALIPMLYLQVNTVRRGRPTRQSLGRITGQRPHSKLLTPAGSGGVATKPNRWIVFDVTAGHCESQHQAPAGWKMATAEEAAQRMRQRIKSQTPEDDLRQQVVGVMGRPVWRNLAYLAAIRDRADQVLDTECTLPWRDLIDQLQLHAELDQGLLYNSSLLFNPYAYFGAWAVFPKAMATATKFHNSRQFYVRDFRTVLVKHSVSDRSHDAVVMDSRATTRSDRKGLGVKFHSSSPTVFMGHRSFSPAVPVASAYRSQAFWSLLLPCLNPSLLCLVLRLFIQQRLFRELDAFSGYQRLNTSFLNTSVVGFGEDFRFIQGVDVSLLASLLDFWNCDSQLTFYGCYSALAEHIYDNGYLTLSEIKLMKSWVAILQQYAVQEPVRVRKAWIGKRKLGEVGVTLGNLQDRLETASEEDLLRVWNQSVFPIKERCAKVNNNNNSYEWSMHARRWRTAPVLPDLVLIIIFNNYRFLWKNVPVLEAMHRPFFRHIVYCLDKVPTVMKEPDYWAWSHLVLVDGMSKGWLLMYGCVTTVVQMKLPGARGYIMIGDDTLLNTWTFFNIARDTMLLHSFKGRLESIANAKSETRWIWWSTKVGRCALLKAMAELEELSGLSVQQIREMIPGWTHAVKTFTEIRHKEVANLTCTPLPGSEDWPKPSQQVARRFLQNYYQHHGLGGKAPHKATDFLYLPQAVAQDYVEVSRHFMAHQLMIEIAVNVLQAGLSSQGQWQTLQAVSLWGESRRFPERAFSKDHLYMHPLKLAQASSPNMLQLFCNVYLRTLFSKLVLER